MEVCDSFANVPYMFLQVVGIGFSVDKLAQPTMVRRGFCVRLESVKEPCGL